MKKAIISRALMGFPAGIAVGQCISLLVSAILGKGTFEACVPSFVAASAASSVVWAADWSLLKRTVASFLLQTLSMLPVAYVTGWMEHTVKGFLLYFAVFTLIFALIWLCQYLAWKRRVKKLNEKVHNL